jgi:hypothetical protein
LDFKIHVCAHAARDIPPDHFSPHFYYSKFKGGLNKHRDFLKEGTTQFLPGTPIVYVTFEHPVLFEVFALVDKDGNETLSTNAVTKVHQKFVSATLMRHGQVLI